MQEIVHNINLNLSQPNNFEYIHVMQGDYNSEKVVATLFNGNKLYTVDAQKATLQGSTSDGGLILQNNIEISEDKHQVIFEITKEMSSCPGELTCNIVFSSNNQKKSTFPFIIKNTADITGRAPVSVLTTISDYVDRAEKAAKDSETNKVTTDENVIKATEQATIATNKATESDNSAQEAAKSETNAKTSADLASLSATNASTSETNASSSATKAKASEEQSAINATASDNSQREALQSVSNARTAEANTLSHANEAKMAKDSASDYAKLAQSYANGSSGTRTNEETDNAKYYSDQAKSVSNSIPTYIKQIENAGDSQVSRINEALTNASVNFIVDIATGHLMYEGTNKLNFSVNNNGHLEWEVVSL